MADQPEWRIESFQDELDPFANLQWLVLQGDVVIAQCEVRANAELIVASEAQRAAYEQVLQRISAMSSGEHGLESAIDAAVRALEEGRPDAH